MEAISRTAYPGRGIIVGKSEDGQKALVAYCIMGRSVNSRNRVFVAEGEGLRTEAFDPAQLSDPSLIIYAPVRVWKNTLIVTNGDQTDTIYEHLQKGGNFIEALRTRTFEPDAPNYTPRISALLTFADESFTYKMGICKCVDGDPARPLRCFYEYENPLAGEGSFLHTYRGDGNPLPSFAGEPERVTLKGDIDRLTEDIWNRLDADNRVSLFVRAIDLHTGAAQTRIVNRHGAGAGR